MNDNSSQSRQGRIAFFHCVSLVILMEKWRQARFVIILICLLVLLIEVSLDRAKKWLMMGSINLVTDWLDWERLEHCTSHFALRVYASSDSVNHVLRIFVAHTPVTSIRNEKHHHSFAITSSTWAHPVILPIIRSRNLLSRVDLMCSHDWLLMNTGCSFSSCLQSAVCLYLPILSTQSDSSCTLSPRICQS